MSCNKTKPKNQINTGKLLFNSCKNCHGSDGAGILKFRVPAIAGLSDWYIQAQLIKYQKNIRGSHPDDLEGMRMLPMAKTLKSEKEIKAISLYISQLSPKKTTKTITEGSLEAGKQLYGSCVACHGKNAEGMESLKAPNLKITDDWYLFGQLEKFKKGVRGSHPKDSTGQMMRPMAQTLKDDQAIRDIVSYIKSLN